MLRVFTGLSLVIGLSREEQLNLQAKRPIARIVRAHDVIERLHIDIHSLPANTQDLAAATAHRDRPFVSG